MHADSSRYSVLSSSRISADLRPIENCQVARDYNNASVIERERHRQYT